MRPPSVTRPSTVWSKRKSTPSPRASAASALGEHVAIAGFVVRQAQAAGQTVTRLGQRGLGDGELVAIEQFVGHAALLQHGDVALHGVELRLRAEQLQRAAGALLVCDAGVSAQLAQAVAAVFGHAHHALLVDRIAVGRAVPQHGRHPAQLEQAAVGADGQRRVLLEHPLHRLERNAGRGPRRGVAGRDLAGIGKAGFLRRAALAVEHRDLGARTGQVISRRGADDTAAQNDHFHGALHCEQDM